MNTWSATEMIQVLWRLRPGMVHVLYNNLEKNGKTSQVLHKTIFPDDEQREIIFST